MDLDEPPTLEGGEEDDGFGHIRPEDLSDEEDPITVAEEFHENLVTETKRKADTLDESMNEAASSQWEKLFQHSRQSIATSSTAALLYPWQKGFAAKVFSNASHLKPFELKVPRLFEPAVSSTPTVSDINADLIVKRLDNIQGAWTSVSHRLTNLSFHKSQESKRQLALDKWKTVLLLGPEHSKLGRKLLSELLAFKGDNYLDAVLLDSFSRKSTATLSKRGGHILEFFAYCHSVSIQPLPISEPALYDFLRTVRAAKSATSVKSTVESIVFSIGVLGLDGAKEASQSERIVGLSHRLQLTKRPTKQAKPLHRKQIIALERTLMNPKACLQDRVMAGHCLWATHGRLRWNDSLFASSVELDINADSGEGFVEAETLVTKTSTTAQKKTTFLPQVAPIRGLELDDWASKWLQLRLKAGLRQPGELDDEGNLYPLITSVDGGGNFSDNPLSTGDASTWLREIISKGIDSTTMPVEGCTSHCLKATTLAWLSKWGKALPYDRKLLGYHADANESSMRTYSRDVVSGSLRKYQSMLLEVSVGTFDPDASRSGYFPGENLKTVRPAMNLSTGTKVTEEPVTSPFALSDDQSVEAEVEQTVEPFVKPVESVTSDDSYSSSNDPENIPLSKLLQENKRLARKPAQAVGIVRFVHSRLGTVHAGHKDDPLKLACGRCVHAGFKEVLEHDHELNFDYLECSVCFGKN